MLCSYAGTLGFLCVDSYDVTQQKCIFLEVNSRPYLKMHYYLRYGKAEDLSERFAALAALDIQQPDIY